MKKAAVVIGVDRTGGLAPLKSAAAGAERVAAWLAAEDFDVELVTDRHNGAVTWQQVKTVTIERFLRDVYLYVTNRNIAREIDGIVEKALTPDPTVVIGHSLGSVVAYRVVEHNRAKLNLRKFVTVGSPLGLRAISAKLGIPQNPAGPDGWFNAYDHRDIVALNPLDDEFFPTDPAIMNHAGVRNQTDNRHGIVGYLNDAKVADQIAVALEGH